MIDACVLSCANVTDVACLEECFLEGGWVAPVVSSGGTPLWLSLLFALILICLSGLFSGLTLGLMSLDSLGLQIVAEGGEPQEARYARKIMPIRERGNLLLCTLLLGNTVVNALIAILLADISSGVLGLVSSTFLIVTFGEIMPQSICSRHGLMVGAHTIWLVKIFMLVMFPVAWPISKVLDKLLGRDLGLTYSRDELKRLISIHVENPDAQLESGLTKDDHDLLFGVLEYKDKMVRDVHTEVGKVFMLEEDTKLDFETLFEIYKEGFTRIPVYQNSRDNIVGILFSKDLILVDPDDEIKVGTLLSFHGRYIQWVNDQTSLEKVFGIFKKSCLHLLLSYSTDDGHVSESVEQTHYPGNDDINDEDSSQGGKQVTIKRRVTGVITLEDVLEEVIRAEIVDETDNFEDTNNPTHKVRRRDNMKYLSLFEHKVKWQTKLSLQEVQAVSAFLTLNVKEFKEVGINQTALKALVATSELLECNDSYTDRDGEKRTGYTSDDSDERSIELYTSGEESEFFTLIIQGRVVLTVGTEGFESEIGPWNFMGSNALSQEGGPYVPDYSAQAVGVCRLLRIRRADYEACKETYGGKSIPFLSYKDKQMKSALYAESTAHTGKQAAAASRSNPHMREAPMKKKASKEVVKSFPIDREEGAAASTPRKHAGRKTSPPEAGMSQQGLRTSSSQSGGKMVRSTSMDQVRMEIEVLREEQYSSDSDDERREGRKSAITELQ